MKNPIFKVFAITFVALFCIAFCASIAFIFGDVMMRQGNCHKHEYQHHGKNPVELEQSQQSTEESSLDEDAYNAYLIDRSSARLLYPYHPAEEMIYGESEYKGD